MVTSHRHCDLHPLQQQLQGKKENYNKHGIVYKTFSALCQELAKIKRAQGEEASVYIYLGPSNLAMADRGAVHLRDSRREMLGMFNGIHIEVHLGEEPKFGMTYSSMFTRAMGDVVRILYRSKETGVVLLNSKAGDFASYSLPRLTEQIKYFLKLYSA